MNSYYYIMSYFYFYLGDIVCVIMEKLNIYSLYNFYKKCMNKSVKYQDKGNGNGPWMNLK